MNWTDIIGNAATGGALGLLGNALSFGMSYFKDKQAHGFKISEMQLQAQVDAARTAGEVAVSREKGAGEAFTASIDAEAALRTESKWVTDGRSCVRPVLTLLLIFLSAILWFTTDDKGLREYIATNIVVASVAATTWWFGQRAQDRATIAWGNSTAGARVSAK